jgi:Dolichol-phosphate mannosyltransferase subunit 3 (DPM3)
VPNNNSFTFTHPSPTKRQRDNNKQLSFASAAPIQSTMLGLLRYQVFLVYGFVFLAVWQGAKMNQDVATASFTARIVVDFAPLWAILLLGMYAATSIIYKVLTFNDCTDATAELEGQIKEAKAEMRRRKIILGD